MKFCIRVYCMTNFCQNMVVSLIRSSMVLRRVKP